MKIFKAKIMSGLMHENIVGFEAVCYQPLMFMMEIEVYDFKLFSTDKKLTTIEELPRYCDSFMFQNSDSGRGE